MKANYKYITVINFAILLFITILFTFYFYGIARTMLPGEEGISVLAEYFKRSFGDNNGGSFENLIWSIARYLGYRFGKLDLSACYIMLSFCYFLILLVTGYLCLSNGVYIDRKWNWWLLPIFIYLMVLINPGSREFGMSDRHFNVYPFYYHMPAIIHSLVTIIFIRRWLTDIHNRKRLLLCIIAMIVSLLLGADLVYLILSIVPFILIVFCQSMRDKKRNSIFLTGVLFLLLSLVVLKYTSHFTDYLSYWFSDTPISYGEWTVNENVLYGESNFGDIYSIVDRMGNYCKGLLGIFNADVSSKPILRINTLFIFFRIVIVLFIVFKMIQTVTSFLLGKEDDTYGVFLASGFIILSLFFILFEFGHLVVNYRYLSALLPWGTLYFCHQLMKDGRNIILKIFNCPLLKHNFNLIIIIFFTILCLFDFRFIYSENQYTETDENNVKVSDYLSEQGLVYGFSPYWLTYPLTLPNAGDSILFSAFINSNATGLETDFFGISPNENYHHEYCNYIVVGDGTIYDYMYDGRGIDWLTEQYGTPIMTKQLDNEYVLVYNYNIGITPRVYNSQAVQWYSYGTSSDNVTVTPKKPLYCPVSDLPVGIWEIRLYGTKLDNLTAKLGTLDVLYSKTEKDYTAWGFEVRQRSDYGVFLSQKTGESSLDKIMIVNVSNGIDLYDGPISVDANSKCPLLLDDFTGTCDIIAYSSDSRKLSLHIGNEIIKPVAQGDDRCIWRVDTTEIADADTSYIVTSRNTTSQVDRITICTTNMLEAPMASEIYWVNKELSTLSELMRFDQAFAMVPGQTVFGPYITLEPGKYQIIWDAKTFGDRSVDFTVTSAYGTCTIPISSYTVLDDSVIISFEIAEPTKNIEFVCNNNSEKMILISNVKVLLEK